jgi:protocatechuate 3,4-dioxygenase beta subunit
MKPLVVLLLVLGSLGALIFALTALTGDGRGGAERGVTVAPSPAASAGEAAPAALADPVAAVEARRGEEQTQETATRQALEPQVVGQRTAYGSIVGIVVDPEDAPIAEARVSLLNMRPSVLGEDQHLLKGTEPPRPTAKVVTGEDGTFRFDQLDPRKDWTIVVTHDRFRRWESDQPILIPEGSAWNERVQLRPGHTLSGVVRDAGTKQPIGGVALTVDGQWSAYGNKKRSSSSRLETVTDASGSYSFSNVSASPMQPRVLTITAPGYATQVHNNFAMVTLGEAPTRFKNVQPPAKLESRTQDFELEPGRSIAGRVIGPDGAGMAGVDIEALGQTGTVGSQGFATSAAGGEFLIEGLAEGIYTLRVTATNLDADPKQRIEAGDTNVLIELFELAMVTGRVVDVDGSPMKGFVVKARQVNPQQVVPGIGAVMAQSKGSTEGRFELRGLPDGSYVIEAQAPGYAASFSEMFTATQGLVTSDIVVRMTRGGGLRGRVLDAYSNAPVGGVEVRTQDNDFIDGGLWALFSELEPSAYTKATVFTDADGRFEIEVMTPGLYQVQVRGKGYSAAMTQNVNVIDGQVTEMPALLLSKGAQITGIVYGADRAALPGASVQLTPSDPSQLQGHRQARTDANGRYVFENARPGNYQLSASRPHASSGNPFEAIADMKTSEIEVSIDDGQRYELDLRLGPVGN